MFEFIYDMFITFSKTDIDEKVKMLIERVRRKEELLKRTSELIKKKDKNYNKLWELYEYSDSVNKKINESHSEIVEKLLKEIKELSESNRAKDIKIYQLKSEIAGDKNDNI